MTKQEFVLALAMLAQLGFTFIVMARAGRARFAAGKAGRIKGDIALSARGWPEDVLKLSNNMNNQFETPTLFYALVLLALVLHQASWPLAVLAWIFVASRVAHMLVHTGSNRVIKRFKIFMVGVGMLMAMTALLAFQIIVTGSLA